MKRPRIRSGLGRALSAVRGWPWLVPPWPRLVPRGRARLSGLLLSGVVLAGAGTQVGVGWATALPENAVFRVGDTVLTEQEFQQRVDVLKALYGVKPPKQGPKRVQFDKDAAKSIAVSLVLDRAAQQRNVVVAEKKARDALNEIIEKKMPGGRKSFTQFLSSTGLAERDVLDEVKRQLATSTLFQQVTSDAQPVTDKELRQYYHQHKKELERPEKRHLRNIVVQSQAKAQQLLDQARAGADFATLAKKHSLDRSTKTKGGDLGTVTAKQLDKQYAQVAFQADKKSFFGPVQTKHGWNIGQVLKITPAEQLSFNEAKKQLKAQLTNKRKLDTWRTWLGNQIKAADIEYSDKYRPTNPDAPPR